MKPPKLTPDLEHQILASIRAGGYPHIAAAAWGINEETFNRWVETGRKPRGKQLYKNFVKKIEQAQAQARLKAEMKAMEDDPRFWLKNGPGKEQPNNPGWAAMVRPMVTGNTNTINLFMSPEFIQFMATLRHVLAPHPEALKALTVALDGAVKEQDTLIVPPCGALESVPQGGGAAG